MFEKLANVFKKPDYPKNKKEYFKLSTCLEPILDGCVKYEVVMIDNCQYIVTGTSGYGFSITHKGNCNNPMHIYNNV